MAPLLVSLQTIWWPGHLVKRWTPGRLSGMWHPSVLHLCAQATQNRRGSRGCRQLMPVAKHLALRQQQFDAFYGGQHQQSAASSSNRAASGIHAHVWQHGPGGVSYFDGVIHFPVTICFFMVWASLLYFMQVWAS